ncbi:methylated-DNA--[protein]-cysteine S-methyltransferase [Terriglobus saanensis]|nr:methylated-DNA--[protein]-cysteine S-methyltransferase [Terriglobus saanensis]
MIEHFLMESPLGTLTLVNTNGVLSGLYMPDHLRGPKAHSLGSRTTTGFDVVRSQLDEYFERKRVHFEVPILLHGTAFQQSVWKLLQPIPYGETRSYGELADLLGNHLAIRAVGLANGRNPVSIIIPCHRVVGSNGSLTGYAGGLERKRRLLELEATDLTLQKQFSLS